MAPESINNIAVTGFRISGRAIVDSDVVLECDIANYSDQDTDVKIHIDLIETQMAVTGKVNAQSVGTLTASMKFTQPQWVSGWIELQGNSDAIVADDTRPIAFRIDSPPKIVVLTKTTPKKEAKSAFFLRQALEVIAGPASLEGKANSNASSRYQTIDPSNSTVESTAESLRDADIYLINHCGALDRSNVDMISLRVRRGKG